MSCSWTMVHFYNLINHDGHHVIMLSWIISHFTNMITIRYLKNVAYQITDDETTPMKHHEISQTQAPEPSLCADPSCTEPWCWWWAIKVWSWRPTEVPKVWWFSVKERRKKYGNMRKFWNLWNSKLSETILFNSERNLYEIPNNGEVFHYQVCLPERNHVISIQMNQENICSNVQTRFCFKISRRTSTRAAAEPPHRRGGRRSSLGVANATERRSSGQLVMSEIWLMDLMVNLHTWHPIWLMERWFQVWHSMERNISPLVKRFGINHGIAVLPKGKRRRVFPCPVYRSLRTGFCRCFVFSFVLSWTWSMMLRENATLMWPFPSNSKVGFFGQKLVYSLNCRLATAKILNWKMNI